MAKVLPLAAADACTLEAILSWLDGVAEVEEPGAELNAAAKEPEEDWYIEKSEVESETLEIPNETKELEDRPGVPLTQYLRVFNVV